MAVEFYLQSLPRVYPMTSEESVQGVLEEELKVVMANYAEWSVPEKLDEVF